MNATDVFHTYGLTDAQRIKLVRHGETEFDLQRLYHQGQIELYQSVQGNDVFSNCSTIVSFLNDGGSRSKFIGVYHVKGVTIEPSFAWPEGYLYPTMPTGSFVYHLERDVRFEDLEGRLIIDWGKSVRAWHQWFRDKEIIEILPRGFTRPFPGFLDFILDFSELKRMIAAPEANREWHHKLGSVAGIYLITDSSTGLQYVGSAYGSHGILGRWSTYAQTGHGGNERLVQLLQADPDYAHRFRFTILRTLPQSLTKSEVINFENLYKEKLGTRAFGLNAN